MPTPRLTGPKGTGSPSPWRATSRPLSGPAAEGSVTKASPTAWRSSSIWWTTPGEGSNSVGVYTGGAAPTAPAVKPRRDWDRPAQRTSVPGRHRLRRCGSDPHTDGHDRPGPHLDGQLRGGHPGVPLGRAPDTSGSRPGLENCLLCQTIKSWTFTEATPSPAVNRPPAIMTAAKVILETPTSVVLGGGATDDGGADNLTYTWTVISTPGGASPRVEPDLQSRLSDGGPRHSRPDRRLHLPVHRPRRPGADRHQFRPLTSSPRRSAAWTSAPRRRPFADDGTAQFTAAPLDQFGHPMPLSGPVAWQVLSGPGSIDADGLYTAPADADGNSGRSGPSSRPARRLVAGDATVTVVPANSAVPAARWTSAAGSTARSLTRTGRAGDRQPAPTGERRLTRRGALTPPTPVDVRGFTTSFQFQVGNAPVVAVWGRAHVRPSERRTGSRRGGGRRARLRRASGRAWPSSSTWWTTPARGPTRSACTRTGPPRPPRPTRLVPTTRSTPDPVRITATGVRGHAEL